MVGMLEPADATLNSAEVSPRNCRHPSVRLMLALAEILLFAAVYFTTGKLGLLLSVVSGNSTPIWVPTGLSLVYVWFRGYRYLPGVTLGALFVNLSTGAPWWVVLMMVTGNTLETLAGVWMLRRTGFSPRLERMCDVVLLLALPMPLSTMISALFGAAALSLAGIVTPHNFLPCLLIWWLGDALSVVVIAPLLLTWRLGGVARLSGRSWRETLFVFGGLIAATAFAFSFKSTGSHDFLLLVLALPFLTAAAVRYGPRGTTAGIFAVSMIAILGTISGAGPFNSDTALSNVSRLNVFLGVVGMKAMILCSLMQEHKRNERILRTERMTFTVAESLAKIGSFQCDPAGRFVWWSDEMYRLCGQPEGEPLGTKSEFASRYVHPEDRDRMSELSMRGADPDSPERARFRLVARDGRIKHVERQGRPRFATDGSVIDYTGTMQDITERVTADAALKASESRYRLLADHAGDVITRQALDGTFLYLSPSVRNLTGFSPEEIVGRAPDEWIHPDDVMFVSRVREALTETPTTLAFRVRHREGHFSWVEMCGNIIRPPDGPPEIICQIRDISERRRLEEQIQQSQKMEAIGRLAGGIAHDFNNLLTVINGFSEVLIESLSDDDPSLPLLTDIRQAGLSAAGLTAQLLAFSRRQLVTRKVVDLNETVRESHSLLSRLLGDQIRLTIVPAPGRADILADVGQLNQVVMNLIVNARDAMPSGGEINLTVTRRRLADEGAPGGMHPGDYVVLSVSDNGSGIDEATKALIFEPFFTTKEQGKGTGLGLATVYAIMQQAKGRITVESEVGRGTTFRLYWPAEETPDSADFSGSDSTVISLGECEVILVVEDDDAVRTLTSRVLRERGYRVIEAADGLEALRVCEKRGAPVDLVVTDVVMPHMNGRELAAKLHRMWPRVPVLFLSGYSPEPMLRQDVREERVQLMAKPFTPESLLSKVREMLDRQTVRS